MRKLIAVPQAVFTAMERRQQVKDTPEVREAMRIDEKIASVLNEKHLSDSEKARRYYDVLENYMRLHNEVIGQQSDGHYTAAIGASSSFNPYSTERILDTMPMLKRKKADQLIRHVRDRIDWDPVSGEIIPTGEQPIRGSNIIDLVRAAVAGQNNVRAAGWNEFQQLLVRSNVPRSLLGPNRPPRVGVSTTPTASTAPPSRSPPALPPMQPAALSTSPTRPGGPSTRRLRTRAQHPEPDPAQGWTKF